VTSVILRLTQCFPATHQSSSFDKRPSWRRLSGVMPSSRTYSQGTWTSLRHRNRHCVRRVSQLLLDFFHLLCPISNVRDRIMKEAEEQAQAEYEEFKRVRKANRRRRLRRNKRSDDAHTAENARPFVAKNKLKDFLNEGDKQAGQTGSQGEGGNGDEQEDNKYGSKPIADLFPAGMLYSSSVPSPNIASCLVSELCRQLNCFARSHCVVCRYCW
jgi:hypothetical protein